MLPETLVEKFRGIVPRVDDLILDQATSPVERHLLQEGSVLRQQSEFIAEKLDGIDREVKKTNGRVTKTEARLNEGDLKLKAHGEAVENMKRREKNWRRLINFFAFGIGPVASGLVIEFIRWKFFK